jgi:SM-20-related protein
MSRERLDELRKSVLFRMVIQPLAKAAPSYGHQPGLRAQAWDSRGIVGVEAIASKLRSGGFVAVENALSPQLRARLDERCRASATAGFTPAAVGRSERRTHDAGIRGDVIRWLDHAMATDCSFLTVMEDLRIGLNEQLYLGLFKYECHYAIYGVGAHYDRHLDTLSGEKNRLLSTVVYLHDKWAPADGGELLLYRAGNQSAIARILPKPGLMVLFLSEEFPHEVLSAKRPRHSIAGWFRGRDASHP